MTARETPAPQEGPILAGLREIGYEVGSLAELRHSGARYRTAIPILLAALPRIADEKTMLEVVRALSVPWARPLATEPLIKLFRSVADPSGLGLRWAVGNALEVVWDDSHFDALVDLARDGSYGRAREMVVLGLARSRRSEAGDVLVELLDDPVVSGHAVKALRTVKVPAARAALERMRGDQRAWVRKEAQRALAALE